MRQKAHRNQQVTGAVFRAKVLVIDFALFLPSLQFSMSIDSVSFWCALRGKTDRGDS
jgi:hypothetical protein